MTKRKRIGLSYSYNENWIGGTYYIENLINALNTLDEVLKPHLVLIINKRSDYKAAKNNLSYPYMSFRLGTGETNFAARFANKITNRLLRKTFFNQTIKKLEAVFPYYKSKPQSLATNKIYWIADFQEHFSPEFFSAEAIEGRKRNQMEIQGSSEHLILSSQNAAGHFKSLYPEHSVNVHVLPFAVTHPAYRNLTIGPLLKKFDLPDVYFLCPNQFWKHKNQLTVIQAVHRLKNDGTNITVAFTGNTADLRNPEYFIELNIYVQQNNLTDNIRFLGFIKREEQLQLMNNAVAIVQPSLFEGWSTVVEDAKSMNKALIVSDIEVHQEQLVDSSARFFAPLNVKDLAAKLELAISAHPLPSLYANPDYQRNIKNFGNGFLRIALQETA
ncbi:glycosyltransferase [Mucilaginibacter rubeus]|nr:glycosyltransferase [Mucilaginibacter rubeus]